MVHLSKLKNKKSYIPGLWNLQLNSLVRKYWIENFKESTLFISSLMRTKYSNNFKKGMSTIISKIYGKEYTTVHDITVERELLLNKIDCPDPFYYIKKKESNEALEKLDELLFRIKNLDPKNRISLSINAILEGNLFDLGSPITSELWKNNKLKFNLKKKQNIPSEILSYLLLEKKAVILVDNAGYDFILGSVSFIITLLQLEWEITVAANSNPSLNDITISEIHQLNGSICKINKIWERAYKIGQLQFIPSGVFTPGINLMKISKELNNNINLSSTIIFIGQGRAIETTLNAIISKDIIRIAKVKDKCVANKLNLEQLSNFINLTINE